MLNNISIAEIKENSEEISYSKVQKLYHNNLSKIVEHKTLGNTYIVFIGCCAYVIWHDTDNRKWFIY